MSRGWRGRCGSSTAHSPAAHNRTRSVLSRLPSSGQRGDSRFWPLLQDAGPAHTPFWLGPDSSVLVCSFRAMCKELRVCWLRLALNTTNRAPRLCQHGESSANREGRGCCYRARERDIPKGLWGSAGLSACEAPLLTPMRAKGGGCRGGQAALQGRRGAAGAQWWTGASRHCQAMSPNALPFLRCDPEGRGRRIPPLA